MTTDHDFRDQEPVWVKYLILSNHEHNKYYEVRIDLADSGLFVLTKRWGARPDVGRGQIKVESSQSMSYLRGLADAQINNKTRKGYWYTTRPASADSRVAVDQEPEDY